LVLKRRHLKKEDQGNTTALFPPGKMLSMPQRITMTFY
jgi:hypothetical protein